MIENLPSYISITFLLTTIATLSFFYYAVKKATTTHASKKANTILLVSVIWLAVQAVLSIKNVYNSNTTSIPPKIMLLGILPPIVTIIITFATKKGRAFIDSLPLKNLTFLNVVRIPVEIVLFWLFIHKAIPQVMTFEGRNFDILAGITAPLIVYFGFAKNKLSRAFILIWNILCLGLLLNIVVIALASAPSPLQQLAFDQPDIAILNFPFSWLPSFIVPIVLFGHFVSIRQLLRSKKHNKLSSIYFN